MLSFLVHAFPICLENQIKIKKENDVFDSNSTRKSTANCVRTIHTIRTIRLRAKIIARTINPTHYACFDEGQVVSRYGVIYIRDLKNHLRLNTPAFVILIRHSRQPLLSS